MEQIKVLIEQNFAHLEQISTSVIFNIQTPGKRMEQIRNTCGTKFYPHRTKIYTLGTNKFILFYYYTHHVTKLCWWADLERNIITTGALLERAEEDPSIPASHQPITTGQQAYWYDATSLPRASTAGISSMCIVKN